MTKISTGKASARTCGVFLDQMHKINRTPQYYWMDALCLDQNSQAEKEQQVPHMGEIYSAASCTISWLGRATSSSPQHIQNLEDQIQGLVDWVKRSQHTNDFTSWAENERYRTTGLEAVHFPVPTILQNTYWKRVWVVQEVALAQKVYIVFGNKFLDCDDFFPTYKLYISQSSERHHRPAAIEARNRQAGFSSRQILKWGLDCSSFEPMDRIYGLLGLLKHETEGMSYLHRLKPDYSKSPTDLFWELVYGLLLDQSLWISSTSSTLDFGMINTLQTCLSYHSFEEDDLKAFALSSKNSTLHRSLAEVSLRVLSIHQAMGSCLSQEVLGYVFTSSTGQHTWRVQARTQAHSWGPVLSACRKAASHSRLRDDEITGALTLALWAAHKSHIHHLSAGKWRCLNAQDTYAWIDHHRHPLRVEVSGRLYNQLELQTFVQQLRTLYSMDEEVELEKDHYMSPLFLDIEEAGWAFMFRPLRSALKWEPGPDVRENENLMQYRQTMDVGELFMFFGDGVQDEQG